MCDLLTFKFTFQRYKMFKGNITPCSLLTPITKEPEYTNVYQRGAGLLQRRARVIQYKVHSSVFSTGNGEALHQTTNNKPLV